MADLPEPEPDAPPEAGGLWGRYRSLPVGLQILAPLVVLAVIIGGIVWATGGSDGDVATSETTTGSGDSAIEVVLKGLVVTGALTDPSVPTTDAPASTAEPTSTPTTPPTTTTVATTEPATTAPAAPVVPTTPPPDVTEPPDTTAPPDTERAARHRATRHRATGDRATRHQRTGDHRGAADDGRRESGAPGGGGVLRPVE
jgi:hypothetical protein